MSRFVSLVACLSCHVLLYSISCNLPPRTCWSFALSFIFCQLGILLMTISWKLSAAVYALCGPLFLSNSLPLCLSFLFFIVASFLRLTYIFVSIVFPFQMSFAFSCSALLWQLCLPFLANSFLWKCWKAEKFIAVKCRRHTADSGTDSKTDRQTEQTERRADRQTERLVNWPKEAAVVAKNIARAGCALLMGRSL